MKRTLSDFYLNFRSQSKVEKFSSYKICHDNFKPRTVVEAKECMNSDNPNVEQLSIISDYLLTIDIEEKIGANMYLSSIAFSPRDDEVSIYAQKCLIKTTYYPSFPSSDFSYVNTFNFLLDQCSEDNHRSAAALSIMGAVFESITDRSFVTTDILMRIMRIVTNNVSFLGLLLAMVDGNAEVPKDYFMEILPLIEKLINDTRNEIAQIGIELVIDALSHGVEEAMNYLSICFEKFFNENDQHICKSLLQLLSYIESPPNQYIDFILFTLSCGVHSVESLALKVIIKYAGEWPEQYEKAISDILTKNLDKYSYQSKSDAIYFLSAAKNNTISNTDLCQLISYQVESGADYEVYLQKLYQILTESHDLTENEKIHNIIYSIIDVLEEITISGEPTNALLSEKIISFMVAA